VHLFQELAHVRACDSGEKDKLEVNSLHFSLSKVQFVLQQLKQDVILMEVKCREAFKIRIIKASKENINFKADIFGNA